jgi:hypothetical protein
MCVGSFITNYVKRFYLNITWIRVHMVWYHDTWLSFENGLYLLCSIWLTDYLQFYVPLKNFSLLWRRHQCRWRAEKFRPMLGVQGLWAGRDLYRATPAATRDLGFSSLSEGPPHSVASYDTRGDVEGGIRSILTPILTGFCIIWMFWTVFYLRNEGDFSSFYRIWSKLGQFTHYKPRSGL